MPTKTKAKERANARTFHGKPVVDAIDAIILRVMDEDGGTPGKSDDCRAFHAGKRAWPGADIAIFETVSLIEVNPGTVTRFRNSAEMRKAIKVFDETGEMPSGVYRLAPIPPTRTLGARSAENKARGDARKGRVKQPTENTGIANGKPPKYSRGKPQYDAITK